MFMPLKVNRQMTLLGYFGTLYVFTHFSKVPYLSRVIYLICSLESKSLNHNLRSPFVKIIKIITG